MKNLNSKKPSLAMLIFGVYIFFLFLPKISLSKNLIIGDNTFNFNCGQACGYQHWFGMANIPRTNTLKIDSPLFKQVYHEGQLMHVRTSGEVLRNYRWAPDCHCHSAWGNTCKKIKYYLKAVSVATVINYDLKQRYPSGFAGESELDKADCSEAGNFCQHSHFPMIQPHADYSAYKVIYGAAFPSSWGGSWSSPAWATVIGRKYIFDRTFVIPSESHNNPDKPDIISFYPSFWSRAANGCWDNLNVGSYAELIYIKPNKVNGQCGFLTNSCVAGSFRDKPDSPSQWLWDCVGTGGGATAPCAKDKPPVNGQCPPPSWPVNSCTKGSLQDVPDTDSHWFWNCLGSRGGITAHCSRLKPPINGQCGWRINSCLKGDFQDKPDSPTQYLWLCLGKNGGSTAQCFRNRIQPQCGPANGKSYDYLSITNSNLCSPGRPEGRFTHTPLPGNGRWVWKCHNDGLTVFCTAFQNGACQKNPTSRSNACQRGTRVALRQDNNTRKWTWKCGTGSGGDGYSAVTCSCQPTVTYSCQKPPESSLDCTGKCGQTVQADYIPMRIESGCFGTSTNGILDAKYQAHEGTSCAINKVTKTCPPCTHGSIYESN